MNNNKKIGNSPSQTHMEDVTRIHVEVSAESNVRRAALASYVWHFRALLGVSRLNRAVGRRSRGVAPEDGETPLLSAVISPAVDVEFEALRAAGGRGGGGELGWSAWASVRE